MSSSTSPSPSPLTHPIKYDVFLSFRGLDTRTKFTDHLYKALQVQEGIPTFRDSEELEKGEDLSQLFEAIEKSKIAVVILSSNYASSTWCLREVAKIVECRNKSGLIGLPVFYEIEPAQVRYQTGKFKEYFDKHEKRCKDSIGEVKSWKQALTEVAGLSGWDLKDSLETTVIKEIVKCVDRKWKLKFNPAFSIEDSKDFVGLDRVREIEIDLHIISGSDKVGVIGICGMPGVGKTTIAEVVFRRNWHHFEANSFIANVGETRKKKNGLLHIQNQLYHDLLDSKVITINDVPAERRKLSHKKVLIILDGVTELDFIVELVGRGGDELINWFGQGSRIIITTIDEKLLERYKAKIHKVERLDENEARLLFFRKTFNKDQPLHDFANLSYKFVDFADGLPLAIVALGSLLLERTLDEWKAELRTLEANNYTGYEKLFVILTVCINGLRSGAKDIFLDIACFFKGDDKKRAERIFESCGHNPVVNLKILLEKSLVTIVGGKLWMHDLLQETGQKMVIGKPELELGKRSRLWHHKEAISVLKQDKGTSAVRGIFLRSPRPDKVRLKADSFSNMDFLRLLKIKNVIFSGCLEYDLSNELSLLEWHSFASTSLPSNFEPKKLVELHLPQSRIKQLWEDTTTPRLEKLVIMDLSDCKYLTSTPDFQSVPNLESLILKGCTRLSEVHLPDGNHLQKLILLNLEGCDSLSSLPNDICSLRSLTTLILSGCSKLANLPEKFGEKMKQLSELDLEGTSIKELPAASIKHLTGLIRLNLRDCKNLLSLPAIICSLTKLQVLNLSGCLKLDELPENLGSLVGLKELDASRSCIRQVPSSILLLKDLESLSFRGCEGLQLTASFSGLDSLKKLDISYCKLSDGEIPADLYFLSSLDHLNLSGNSLVRVPESITKLSKLEVLLLNDCSRLRSLPPLPKSIQRVFARNCPLLETYSNKLTVWTSTATGFCFINSQISEEHKLHRIPMTEQRLLRPHLQKFYEDIIYKGNGFEYITPHTKIPSWFDRQSEGSSITIPLPPDYFNGELELMGFALCFVYEAQDHENMESTTSTISAQQVKYSCNYSCHLSTCGGPDDDCPLLVCKLMDHDYIGSFRHWVYISGGLFAERLNNRSVRAQVIIDRPGVEVKACGASLIYSGGVTEFVWNLNLRDEILSHMRNLSSRDQKENPNDQSNEQEEEEAETTEQHRYQLELEDVPVPKNDTIFLFYTKGRKKQSLDHDASRTGSSTQVPHQRLERPESNDESNEQEQGTNSQLTHVAESGCSSDTRDNSTSTKIVGDQLRKNVESFLEGLFEPGSKARIDEIGFIFSHQAILPWFTHQCIGNIFISKEERIGSAVALPLPPELYNNKEWVGFALYVSFTLPPGVWDEKSCCFFRCSLYSDYGVCVRSLKLWSYGEDNFIGSHRLLVIHIPRGHLRERLNQCRSICATFVSDDSLTPSVEAEMCGIRVVYEQDLKGLIQTITECTITSSPAVYYGLARSFVISARNSYVLAIMKNNLIEAAESSERRLSTLQVPLRDSEFISDQQIYLEIQAGFPYIPLKNKDSVVEGKRNLELLLERFFALSADLRVKITLKSYASSFSIYCNPLPCSESMVSELPPNLENDVNFMQTIKQWLTFFFDNEDVIRANLVDYSEDGTTCSSDGTTPVFPGETSGKSNHQLELGASSTSLEEGGKSHLMQLITGNVVEERGPGPDLIPFFIEIEPTASSTKITGQLRGNIESSLEQLFQGGNARHYHYGFILSPRVGAVMPWFSHHTIGTNGTYIMDLPRDLHKDKKWVGFALYVAFTQSPDSDFGCECGLFGFPGNTVISVITWCPVQFSGSQPRLCFIHIPRARLPEQCNDSTIFAKFTFHPPAASEVEMCGMRVVYDEDVKGLVQTITQSTICSPHPVLFSRDDKTEISPRGNPLQIITMATSLVAHSKACIEPAPGGLVPSQKFGKVELLILINGVHTPFKKIDTIEWKRNFERLLQSFFRLDLVIKLVLGEDIIARYEDSSHDSCLFPQKEIPDWFTEKSLTSTFVTRLPDDLESDNNWMGFVVCAAFSVHPHPTDVGNYNDSQLNAQINCKLRWSSNPSLSMSSRDAVIGVRPNNKFIWLTRRGFICLRFIACHKFEYVMRNRSHRQLEASFESGSPALAVQKCSLRILYKQDMQEYKRTLIQCFASVFDNLDHSSPYKEDDDSQHNKEPIHEDDQIDSFGTTSLSEDTQHETKTTVPIPQSETSANSFNHFNSILFKPILYDNKTAVIFADFRGWEE